MAHAHPKKIIINGINLFDILHVTDFKFEVTVAEPQKVWIEGFVKGSLVIDNEEVTTKDNE